MTTGKASIRSARRKSSSPARARTSKTPTCVYLAMRGYRAANVPLVPGMPLPVELLAVKTPLIVGLGPRRTA